MEKTILDGTLSSIRKEFYALRNGMIADILRKGGLGHRYIFGLQLPQIKCMAEKFLTITDEEALTLARALWNDRECREARLLACHLMPIALTTKDEAMKWAEEVATREEADILAFRLIRYLSYANEIADTLAHSNSQLKKYTSTAIHRFL